MLMYLFMRHSIRQVCSIFNISVNEISEQRVSADFCSLVNIVQFCWAGFYHHLGFVYTCRQRYHFAHHLKMSSMQFYGAVYT